MNINVQFSDKTESTITTLFGGPQSPDNFNFLGEVELSDPRYITFYDSLPGYASAGMPQPEQP